MMLWIYVFHPQSLHRELATCAVILQLRRMLVLYSAPRGFFPGSPNFPCPPKIDISKSQFDRMRENHFRVSGASWLNIINHKNPLLRNWLLKALNVFCVLQQEKTLPYVFWEFRF